jgi:L-2-amino-thiazoline-4-carboxylic acid hydrolase
MNIKLFLMSIWIPKFVLINELEQTSKIINKSIDDLLERYSIPKPIIDTQMKGNLDERRLIMAKNHKILINCIIERFGFEKALKICRKELFEAGHMMGCNTKERLKVKNVDDAIVAARIIYKVLGINFIIEKNRKDIVLRIQSCTLATIYSTETCEIMSAVDEGVMKGLNEKMSMNFTKRITEGAEECAACINIKS